MGADRSPFRLAVIVIIVMFNSAKCQDITKSIAEEKAKDVYILNIRQSMEEKVIPGTYYRIITGSEYVKITKSGDLKTKSKMDREKICPDNRPKCFVDIEVLAFPPKELSNLPPKMIKVQLTLTDVNDNDPVFENKIIQKQISEQTDIGSVIRLDSAVDSDYGKNSIANYEIELIEQPGSTQRTKAYFDLEVIENIDGTKIPQLILKRKFDREELAVHELKLIAVDGGRPARRGVARVRINVTDSNDNQPTFEEKNYLINVAEDTKPNSVIATVLATDLDKGINGKIRYSFPSAVSSSDRELFDLNENTGEITLKKLLDYEVKMMHHLTVEAEDMGPNPTSAYTTVTIKVLDVNDNYPEIEVSFFSGPVTYEDDKIVATVSEDAELGRYLGFVTITDGDKGINGSVSSTMLSKEFKLEKMPGVGDRYMLKTQQELDREKVDSYELLIEAKDLGIVPLGNSKSLLIKVGDVNDNSPFFDHEEFIAGVSESAKAQTKFDELKVNACSISICRYCNNYNLISGH